MYNEILGLVTFIATFVLMVLMYRFFGKQGLIAWVAIGTIIANIQVIKTVEIFGISATLGNVMFASIYLATDILNDIYGRRVAKRAVLVRLFININYDYCYAIVITFYSCTRRYGTKSITRNL
ncbi:queuosine precursor transporter [Staphylococcus aureus]